MEKNNLKGICRFDLSRFQQQKPNLNDLSYGQHKFMNLEKVHGNASQDHTEPNEALKVGV